MKMTWNVNGLGNVRKRKQIKEVTMRANPDIVIL